MVEFKYTEHLLDFMSVLQIFQITPSIVRPSYHIWSFSLKRHALDLRRSNIYINDLRRCTATAAAFLSVKVITSSSCWLTEPWRLSPPHSLTRSARPWRV